MSDWLMSEDYWRGEAPSKRLVEVLRDAGTVTTKLFGFGVPFQLRVCGQSLRMDFKMEPPRYAAYVKATSGKEFGTVGDEFTERAIISTIRATVAGMLYDSKNPPKVEQDAE